MTPFQQIAEEIQDQTFTRLSVTITDTRLDVSGPADGEFVIGIEFRGGQYYDAYDGKVLGTNADSVCDTLHKWRYFDCIPHELRYYTGPDGGVFRESEGDHDAQVWNVDLFRWTNFTGIESPDGKIHPRFKLITQKQAMELTGEPQDDE